ncbi:MAG: ABC transporter permease [Anaerolineales bacterium]|nr:ABC transporter permease [Anaerolineales bacterium]
MLSRIWSISIKEFLHLRYDWWLPAFMLIGGAIELLLIGWATSRPITNLPIMVLDHDRSASSREIIIALENTGTFQLKSEVYDFQTIEAALDRGQISAAMIIPPNFGDEMASVNGQPTLSVILNGAESIPATTALRTLEGVTRDIGEQITIQRIGINPETLARFNPSLRVWFNESLSEALYSTPAELGLMMEFIILLFAALTFSREKELGTLESLLVMPFTSLEIIIGKSIPVIIIGMLAFGSMLGMVHLAFDVPVRGSLGLLVILAFVYVFVELGKGLVISVISRTQHQAFLLVMLIGMIDFLFTGYAAPVEGMPKLLQYLANFIPAHHWLDIMRGILLKGAGLDVLWINVLALLILGLVIGTFSLRYVRRSLN